MREFRLRLRDDLLPVQAFFNCWPDYEYLDMLRYAAVGIESTYNDIGWSWWNGEGDTPPSFGEVVFFFKTEDVALQANEALSYFRSATESWLSHQPGHRDEAISLLAQLEKLFTAPDARVR